MSGVWKRLIVTGLGLGYLPGAPGTWGSLGAAAVWVLTAWVFAGAWAPMAIALAASIVLWTTGCVTLGAFVEQTWGRKDPGHCVADEWAGQALTFLLIPAGTSPDRWWLVGGIGFVTFRLFDISKLFPANRAERLKLGWGVAADDLVAGVYANIATRLTIGATFGLWQPWAV